MKRSNKEPERSGDILGLGGAAAPVTGDHRFTGDSDAAKRHKRMNEGADELVPDTTAVEPQSGHGQASVDMGSGGDGTDVD